MLHISLFSGIGGFDLAAEWMGWTNIISCEINDFGNKVLKHYWPNAYHHRDVKTLTLETINKELGKNWRTDDVILTGGFPCQPYSSAGKRKGKEDERHLWPEMLRVIREIKPSYIVGENVAGLLSWSGGLVFDEVHSDLEAEGYEVQAVVIPAAAVNAPHGRDRVWFVAKNTLLDGCVHRQNEQERTNLWEQRNVSTRSSDGFYLSERTAPHSNINTKRPSGKSGSIETSWSGNNDEQDKWGGKTKFNNRSPSFSRTASNSNSNGLHTSDSGHKEQPSKGGLNAQRDANESNDDGDASDSSYKRLERQYREWEGCSEHRNNKRVFTWTENKFNAANTNGIGLRREGNRIGKSGFVSQNQPGNYWSNFPTVSPVRMRNDGVSDKLLRFVVNEFYNTNSCTSQENRIENLQEVWEKIQSEEVWEKIRRLYTLESKIVLFQTMQLYSSKWNKQRELSPFSKEFCKPILQHLSKYGEFRCSPQGQELEKQRNIQFNHSLSFLPHEIALAARRFETAITKFETWHRKESIKAAGNAVVPQVVYEIFKAIEATRK